MTTFSLVLCASRVLRSASFPFWLIDASFFVRITRLPKSNRYFDNFVFPLKSMFLHVSSRSFGQLDKITGLGGVCLARLTMR